ncbi:MAG TPA: helix-turn-helix domain-containing protein [Chloroflexota bacterium]
MSRRAYGQYCGLARAVELVGERWALLMVRDLLVGPKRFTDLRRGLPRIPSNILAVRLKDLEDAGVVHRRLLPRPDGSVVYELTEYGAQLEEAVIALGRWGAKSLGEPGPDEIITVDSMIMALRSTFRPETADGWRATFELRMGEVVVNARIAEGRVEVGPGPLPEADLVIEAGPAIRALMAAEITPSEAVETGSVRLTGDAQLLERFARTFRI